MAPNTGLQAEELVEIASYLAVEESQARFDTPPRGLYFNKVLSLLHRQFQDLGFDIGLPHCWYRYGDEVVRYRMPNPLVWDHEATDKTTVLWNGEPPDALETKEGARVKRALGEIMDEYPIDSMRSLVDHVYSYAPFEFQRSFRAFRNQLREATSAELGVDQLTDSFLLPSLRKAASDFEVREFGDLKEKKAVYTAVLEGLLSASQPDFYLAQEIAENFWFQFCYHLRLHPRAHENVPIETKHHWMEAAETEIPALEGQFGDQLERAVDAAPNLEENATIAPVLEGYRRERDELDSLLEETDTLFEGLEEFSEQAKGAYGG